MYPGQCPVFGKPSREKKTQIIPAKTKPPRSFETLRRSNITLLLPPQQQRYLKHNLHNPYDNRPLVQETKFEDVWQYSGTPNLRLGFAELICRDGDYTGGSD